MNSFKLFWFKRKLAIFSSVEDFFELHSSATEGKKDKNRVENSNFLANQKSLTSSLYKAINIMDLASRKLHLLQQFMNVVNIETIEKLEQFFKKEVEQNTDELPKEVVALLEKSIEDSKAGRTRPHDEVIKELKAKYNLQ